MSLEKTNDTQINKPKVNWGVVAAVIAAIAAVVGIIIAYSEHGADQDERAFIQQKEFYNEQFLREEESFDVLIKKTNENFRLQAHLKEMKNQYDSYGKEIKEYYSLPFAWTSNREFINLLKIKQNKLIEEREVIKINIEWN